MVFLCFFANLFQKFENDRIGKRGVPCLESKLRDVYGYRQCFLKRKVNERDVGERTAGLNKVLNFLVKFAF